MIGAMQACSNQGEGEVCSIENDSEDCQTENGLVCYDHLLLNNTTSDRCCPSDRAKSTHPVCLPNNLIIGDGQAPADTGPSVTPDAQVTDGGVADALDEQ